MVTVDSSVSVARPAQEVFDYVSDPRNDVKWHHNVVAAEKTSDGPIGVGSKFHWDARFLGKRPTDIEITKYEPPRLIEQRLEAGWMKGVVTFIVEPENGTTKVTRRVGIPLPRALGFAAPLVAWGARRSGQHHIEWLHDALEGRTPGEGHSH